MVIVVRRDDRNVEEALERPSTPKPVPRQGQRDQRSQERRDNRGSDAHDETGLEASENIRPLQ